MEKYIFLFSTLFFVFKIALKIILQLQKYYALIILISREEREFLIILLFCFAPHETTYLNASHLGELWKIQFVLI
jgi:hypothetical protein